jgi:hypothetical protein
MKKATDKPVRSQAHEATQDGGKVRLGDGAITFQPETPKKVARDAATADSGKVRLGDGAITFPLRSPRRSRAMPRRPTPARFAWVIWPRHSNREQVQII